MEWLILWPVLCIIVGWAATQKNRSGIGFFFLSFFLSPLIGVLVLIAVPAKVPRGARSPSEPPEPKAEHTAPWGMVLCPKCNARNKKENRQCWRCDSSLSRIEVPELKALTASETKRCRFCAETIQAAAIKCRYCGSDLSLANAAPAPPLTMGQCPGCGKLRGSNVAKCIYCGSTEPVRV